jgi:hypothetical protein
MRYVYTERDRLAEPHTYMYSPFEGSALIAAYLEDRSAALRRHAARKSALSPMDRLILSLAATRLDAAGGHGAQAAHADLARMAGSLGEFTTTRAVDTHALLLGLIATALSGSLSREAAAWLDRLVQRFEVTKKLYESYPAGFRAGAGGYGAVRLYWLFALALCLFHESSRDLQYLSTLLKVCDLLCSIEPASYGDGVPVDGLRLVIGFETGRIRRLAGEKGVPVAAG